MTDHVDSAAVPIGPAGVFRWRPVRAQMRSARTEDIWFLDPDTGWAVDSNGHILHTADGGVTFVRQLHEPDVYFACIAFASPDRGWAGTLTEGKPLFETSNGGTTWSRVTDLPPPVPHALCSLAVVNASVVYAVGTRSPDRPPVMMKTVDSGRTWTAWDMCPWADILTDVYFASPTVGWAVGGKTDRPMPTPRNLKPVVLATRDGGRTWVDRVAGLGDALAVGEWGSKLFFVDERVGFVSLRNPDAGAILKTLDGGLTWQRFAIGTAPPTTNLDGIGFVDGRRGWIGGWAHPGLQDRRACATIDGGATWHDASEIEGGITRFRLVGHPPTVGYASGETIYKYSPAPSIEPPAEAGSGGACHLSLMDDLGVVDTSTSAQIAFSVPPGARRLTIRIWDDFGEPIQTLVDETDPRAGRRVVTWNGSDATGASRSPGDFLLRLTIDDLSDSRRLHFRPVTLEPAKEPEYFHKLVNIERHPEFLPVARNLAKDYLEGANFDADPLYHEFEYTEARFDERLTQIYDGYVASTMYTPHWLDTGFFAWPDESGADRTYSVGRFSDRAVIERLRQLAPLNLVDGAWLQHIVTVGPADKVQANLFAIWNDEAGNGEAAQNHASLYDALLKSVNVHLPPMRSSEFAEYPFLPGAFRGAVFQLSTGLYPAEFFPELLGMTLFFEWESTPTLTPMVRMLAARHINPHFYRIHVAVDNTVGGHGALAKEAVKLYLKQKREEGGERLVQASWRRIWRGYVAWATLGGLGRELAERLFAMDHKTINVSATPDRRTLWPDLRGYHRQRMAALIQRKAPVAKQVHGGRAVAGTPLSELFDDPPRLMQALVEAGYVDVEHPRHSRFLELLAFENGPMYKVFTPAEREIIVDWMESLRTSPGEGADPIEEDSSEDLPSRMAQVIAKYAPQARMAHSGIHLTGPDGHGVPLVDLFDRPRALLQALSTNGWVVPGAADRSLFVTRVASNGGPMDGVIDPPDLEIVRRWIDAGAHLPAADADRTAASVAGYGWPPTGASSRRQRIGMGAIH